MNENPLIRNPLIGKSNEKNIAHSVLLNKSSLIRNPFNNIAVNDSLMDKNSEKISSYKPTVINNAPNKIPIAKKVINEKSDDKNTKNFILMNKIAI